MLPSVPTSACWAYSSLISPGRISLPRKGCRVGLHIVLFEACSAFTRVAACTLARSPIRDPLPEGFRHFVASMPAPVASGWSESPGGTCTHWKAPPCHGAPPKVSLRQDDAIFGGPRHPYRCAAAKGARRSAGQIGLEGLLLLRREMDDRAAAQIADRRDRRGNRKPGGRRMRQHQLFRAHDQRRRTAFGQLRAGRQRNRLREARYGERQAVEPRG